MFKFNYKTPDDYTNLIMTSDGTYLTGLWFEKSKIELDLSNNYIEKLIPVFEETIKWLDLYFSGKVPNFKPIYKLVNITYFQKRVIKYILEIPYGKTITYGEIARKIAFERNIENISPQAVGHAASKNPICIIIPCHRVISKSKKIIGYNGGVKNKMALLKHESNILTNN